MQNTESLLALARHLGSVRRRRTARRLLVGAASVIAAFAFVTLALFAADRFAPLPPALRLAALLGLAGLTLLVTWRRVLAVALFPPDLAATAAQVERMLDPPRGFIRSAAELALVADTRSSAPSETLVEMTVEEAAKQFPPTAPTDVAARVRLRRSLAAAATAVLLWAAVIMLFPADFAVFLERLLHPFGAAAYPSRTRIVSVEAPAVVAAGDAFSAEVTAAGVIPEEAVFTVRTTGGRRTIHDAGEDGRYELRMRSVRESFAFSAAVGDARTPQRDVLVVERPDVVEMQAELVYPAYTELEPAGVAGGDITAVIGTQASVLARFNKPVRTASAVFEDGAEIQADLSDDGAGASFPLAIETSGAYSLRLVDEHGFENAGGRSWQIRALEDSPASVALVRPDRDLSVISTAVLPVEAQADDDYGVRFIWLSYDLEKKSGETSSSRILLEAVARAQQKVPVAYSWDLSTLPLEPGDRINWRIEAVDNRPGEERTTASESREALVVSIAEKLAELDRLSRRLQEDIAQAERLQRRAADQLRVIAPSEGGPS